MQGEKLLYALLQLSMDLLVQLDRPYRMVGNR